MNYFIKDSAAARYAKGRTPFHPLVIRRLKAFFGFDQAVLRALDVGCGTGLSTVALLDVAPCVVGLDPSAAMVAHASRASGLSYVVGRGEVLPFTGATFNLITASSAIHWLDQERLLAEARRVLNPDGRLVIYDNYFRARSGQEDPFHVWHREVCLDKYPNPHRGNVAMGDIGSARDGFMVIGHEEYQHEVAFSVERLVDYLVTQSNVIAAVEEGAEKIEDVRQWLSEQVRPFFGGRREVEFLFGGPIWYLRKA